MLSLRAANDYGPAALIDGDQHKKHSSTRGDHNREDNLGNNDDESNDQMYQPLH